MHKRPKLVSDILYKNGFGAHIIIRMMKDYRKCVIRSLERHELKRNGRLFEPNIYF